MKQGVLVMAYGTPRDLDDVADYYTDIRHGRPPEPDALAELVARYEAIGGRSPLLEITQAQASGLQERLGVRAYLGQKHAKPTIPDAVAEAIADGVERLVGLVLAPHYSKMSIGDYTIRASRAADGAASVEVVPHWHLEPGYISWLADAVTEAAGTLPEAVRADALVIFSAHSLPERILESGDPYPEQLAATAAAVAASVGHANFRVGWQSAGRTADPWIGPDILAVLEEESGSGTTAVVICPCGFVADHLEVLYDIDIEAQARASELSIELRRTPAPNADPKFLDMLAGVVGRALGEPN